MVKEGVKKQARKERLKEKTKASAKKFHSEFKKSVNTAIVAAFGFLIALAWRDVINEYVTQVSGISPLSGKIIGAITITIVAVLGILIVTKITAVKE